jgi:hypothetical protein
VTTVTAGTISLTGSGGPERIVVVPAEGGRLAFITAERGLVSGTLYVLAITGARDLAGQAVPAATVGFTTRPASAAAGPAGAVDVPAPRESTAPSDRADAEWLPGIPGDPAGWRYGGEPNPGRASPRSKRTRA